MQEIVDNIGRVDRKVVGFIQMEEMIEFREKVWGKS